MDPLNKIDPVAFYTSSVAPSPAKMSTTSSVNITEGDLPKSKSSESNILAVSESMTIESLAQMREGVRNEEGSSFIDDLLGDSEPVFDQTPEVRVAPSTDSSDTNEDNIPLK
ncbi:hypothetical protein KY284_007837 [Solanum tuberosum]|nr:hypothetical protein KY284_007837 [Solanum tuberosum]